MDHVDDKDEEGQTQGDELHQPESEQGDGRKQIVAHVGATGLNGVAHESLLLVLVERVTSKEEQQDAEEDHHDEPHFS